MLGVRTTIKRDLTVATTGKDRTVIIIRDYRVGPIGANQLER